MINIVHIEQTFLHIVQRPVSVVQINLHQRYGNGDSPFARIHCDTAGSKNGLKGVEIG